jgi:plasmid stabilization system protein ParE
MIHRYKRDAAQELFDAVQHYEDERPGLGGEFLDEVDRAIDRIKEAPQRWPQVEDRVRRYRLDRFPYGLVYEVHDSTIAIVAIMHLSRRPGYWRKRIK